jgi:hypothetical protein
LELAKRPYKAVGEKRRFLASFLSIVSKKFVDEFSQNDVLAFCNELMVSYDPTLVAPFNIEELQSLCFPSPIQVWNE